MIITIHQPEHLPWLGFFHKMSKADAYVLLDNVQFTKNNFQNRNRVVNRKGDIYWLTVPLSMENHTQKCIRDMEICKKTVWQRKYWGRIVECYAKHPFFEFYSKQLQDIIMQPYGKLIDFNLNLINFFRDVLDIKTPLLQASNLNVKGQSSELLLDICKNLNASAYLSGPDGRNYLDQSIFANNNINLYFHDFKHPTYPSNNFQPYLSTLDIVMNHGPESRQYIL